MKTPSSRHVPRSALAAAVASALVPLSSQAAVGRVDFAYGDVRGISDAGEQRRLSRGAEINEGDTILTNRGRAQLRFTDGARTSLLPNSEFRVDRYDYQEEKEEESTGFFSLLKGGLRTITGVIGRLRKEAYRVVTPSATIGIRGTEYLVVLGESASVWVADGEIEACNEAGCTSFEGGESGYIADNKTKPIKTDTKPDTSGGDVDTDTYSAAEDVNSDGAAVAVSSVFRDGPFYALTVSVGDSLEGTAVALLGSDTQRANATFARDSSLASASDPVLAGSIGSATAVEVGNDGGTIGWGRWVNGTVIIDAFGSLEPVLLSGSESLHYVVGVPTAEMPTSGTGSYSLLGGTSPTYADGSGTGTLNSASLNVDFGTGLLDANVNFSIGGSTFDLDTDSGTSIGVGGTSFGFGDSGSFTSGGACSSGCDTDIFGFFAGSGASRAGVSYQVEEDSGKFINGSVGLARTGPGEPIVPE